MSPFDPFGTAQAIADAVLYEGYVLYPYRASADKNRIRWQWGVVGPAGAHANGVGEESMMATDLPLEVRGEATIRLRLRFLQVVHKQVERVGEGGTRRVEQVTIDGETHVSFDDSIERTVDVVTDLGVGSTNTHANTTTRRFRFDAASERGTLGDVEGALHEIHRSHQPISGEIDVRIEPVDEKVGIVHVEVRNTTGWDGGDRNAANLRSFVGAHVMGAVEGGLFLSTVDPPPEHAIAVAACEAHRLWPVLVGAQRRASLVLASPVILYDQPAIAPESRGSFYDGLEIDEMLTLRVMTMTDEEKAEARATDPRSAAVVDRVEAMVDEEVAGLHGAVRSISTAETAETAEELTGGKPWWDPGIDGRFDPDTDGVVVRGTAVSRGSVVKLHPARRADAHDIFYRDRVATVAAVLHDVDGSVHVAVTIDDDPAAEINDATGRYLYFSPEEIEPLGRRVER